MRLVGPPVIRAFAILSMTAAVLMMGLAANPSPAFAAEALEVIFQKGLSTVGESEALTVTGSAGLVMPSSIGSAEVQLVVRLRGPAGIAQVGTDGSVPEVIGEVAHAFSSETDVAPDGSLRSRIVIPFATLKEPGAYLAEVEFLVDSGVRASGEVWLGKVADEGPKVDVAVVWPLLLGIHRDPDGVFFDRVLEIATADPDGDEGIASLSRLAESVPLWHFTLAVEPIVLTQLRDMSDGFARLDPVGGREELGADAGPATDAGKALSGLSGLATADGVEVIVTPFAGPSVDFLAGNGWRDGLQQVQLGKQVTQQILSLPGIVSGVYPSDLDITTAGLASYGQASVDHVLVQPSVAEDLAEPISPGEVTARVRDRDNQRVTLVFLDEGMQAFMAPPWDVGFFCAGLAATLAGGPVEALVLSPPAGTDIPPATYLTGVGRALTRLDRIETRTLSAFVLANSPGSRPILLDRASTEVPGYIARELQAGVDAAHRAVDDIAAGAGPAVEPVANAQALLYTAESRWWSLPQTSPSVASVGLRYAERARSIAEAELAKIGLVALGPATVVGSSGEVILRLENEATYSVRVDINLAPEGLAVPEGDRLSVDLPPGNTNLPVVVQKTQGAAGLAATVVVGSRTLGETHASVRFVTVWAFLPWGVGALAVILAAAGAVFAVRTKRRKRNRVQA